MRNFIAKVRLPSEYRGRGNFARINNEMSESLWGPKYIALNCAVVRPIGPPIGMKGNSDWGPSSVIVTVTNVFGAVRGRGEAFWPAEFRATRVKRHTSTATQYVV